MSDITNVTTLNWLLKKNQNRKKIFLQVKNQDYIKITKYKTIIPRISEIIKIGC